METGTGTGWTDGRGSRNSYLDGNLSLTTMFLLMCATMGIVDSKYEI